MVRKAPKTGGGTRATASLAALSIAYTVHTYRHDRAADCYGLEAARAMSVAPGRVLKTLLASVDGEIVVGVVPVSSQLDLKALASSVGGKRGVMAEPGAAERASGYVIGGISPLGQRNQHRTVVDTSAMEWTTVFVSGGKRGLEIELRPSDLVLAVRAVTAPIAR